MKRPNVQRKKLNISNAMKRKWIDNVSPAFINALIQIFNFLLIKMIVFSCCSLSEKKISSNDFHFSWGSSFPDIYKCYPNESMEYNPNDSKSCFPRINNSHLLPCGISLSPSSVNQPHILVIGSTGVLGIAITSELRKRNLNYSEIRSHFQYDINSKDTYKMLKEININAVILLVNDNNTKIYQFCRKRKIVIFQIVEEFLESIPTKIVQIKTLPVWGPVYLTPNQKIPGRYFYQCLINETIDFSEIQNKGYTNNFVFSLDLAQFVVDTVIKYQKSKLTQGKIAIPDNFSKISLNELKTLLHEKKCYINNKVRYIHVLESNRQKFEMIWNLIINISNFSPRNNFPSNHNFMSDDYIDKNNIYYNSNKIIRWYNKNESVYTSLIISVSNTERIVSLFPIVLATMNLFLKKYPNISFELLILYCPSSLSGLGKFYEHFKCPLEIQQYIRIIEIPPSYINERKKYHNITYFPEFEIKNIGIRRARGEYIFTGNSDIILPFAFFECVQRKLFTPLSYIRTHREMTRYKKPNQLINYFLSCNDIKYIIQKYANVCENQRYYDDFERNGCGDFQGGHYLMWKRINGFLETAYVFHVDTTLALDFASIPVYLFVRVIGVNLHLVHPKQSKMTKHFHFYDNWFKNAIRQSVSSAMINGYQRKSWGASNLTFIEY
ncbi:hypothetical protein TRFO_10699 [Tritrichomonas foetus]|uniref:Uncharacterized protein n=1 Tax=Tritrichomonas foetus TaxID=1144522 RepID=A0A1J4J700_9EUKA|nr:hypothetical protein TRFO_10699 [Tritrichomonas foetus]|eukprot:OHS95006.1 hypothetical protein TRFO_10699 [Tritrichomonas foetus]